MKYYLLKKDENEFTVSPTSLADNKTIKALNHPIRNKIIQLLKNKPMFVSELSKKLNLHEQKIYYHLNQLATENILEVVEKKEIRGTIAKKYAPTNLNFTYSLSEEWSSLNELLKKSDEKIDLFLKPFLKNGKLNASIVVGSPDPHGPHKARARDGHYAIDLALFLGKYCTGGKNFSTKLDVDIDWNNNLIIIGGPVANLATAKVNESLPVKFSEEQPWGFISKKNHYAEDSIGLICRMKNPFSKEHQILLIAGLRFIGTKAAIMGLTKFTNLVLNRFSDQEEFSCVVQGFDMDGDGRIDNIEILE